MNRESDLEKQLRETMQASVEKLDGATRSKLTQARYRALEQLDSASVSTPWRRWLQERGWFSGRGGWLAPLGAMATVVALTTVLWIGRTDSGLSADAGAAGSFEDIELLADGDALAAMSDEDPEFYEWAGGQEPTGGAG